MLTKDFIVAGKAIFTLEVSDSFAKLNGSKPHYTYKVTKPKFDAPFLFVSLLTGPENTKDYTYMGILFPDTGIFKLTEKSKVGTGNLSVQLLRRICVNLWGNTAYKIEAAGFKLHHEGKCGKCGRRLTVPQSIETGIGPECVKSMKVVYGYPVVSSMDVIREGGYERDVFGDDEEE